MKINLKTFFFPLILTLSFLWGVKHLFSSKDKNSVERKESNFSVERSQDKAPLISQNHKRVLSSVEKKKPTSPPQNPLKKHSKLVRAQAQHQALTDSLDKSKLGFRYSSTVFASLKRRYKGDSKDIVYEDQKWIYTRDPSAKEYELVQIPKGTLGVYTKELVIISSDKEATEQYLKENQLKFVFYSPQTYIVTVVDFSASLDLLESIRKQPFVQSADVQVKSHYMVAK